MYLYILTLVLAGIATISAPLCGPNVLYHIAYASVFGFFSGGYVGLTVVIMEDTVDKINVSSALGVVLLFQGVAVAIGTPVTGKCIHWLLLSARSHKHAHLTFKVTCVISLLHLLVHFFGLILFSVHL